MRKVLVAPVAIVSLTIAGALVAAPKFSTGGQASAVTGIDIFSLTQRARDLPVQEYPAH